MAFLAVKPAGFILQKGFHAENSKEKYARSPRSFFVAMLFYQESPKAGVSNNTGQSPCVEATASQEKALNGRKPDTVSTERSPGCFCRGDWSGAHFLNAIAKSPCYRHPTAHRGLNMLDSSMPAG